MSKFNEDEKLIKLLKTCSTNTFNSFLIPLKHALQTRHNMLLKEERTIDDEYKGHHGDRVVDVQVLEDTCTDFLKDE